MKISRKITLFILAVLIVLAGNTLLGLEQLSRINSELHSAPQYETLQDLQGFLKNFSEGERDKKFAARNILWAGFWGSVLLVGLFAFVLLYTISSPLKELTEAAHHCDDEDFLKNFKTNSKDEVGEVANTFSIIGEKIRELSQGLKKKTGELAECRRTAENQRMEFKQMTVSLDYCLKTLNQDIREALTAILGHGEHLKHACYEKLDAQGKRGVDGIVKGAGKADQMIADILQLADILQSQNVYESTDIRDVIADVLERLKYDVERGNVEVVVDPSLPAVVCDKMKISEVFLKLIDNALKFFSKTAGQRARLEIGHKDHSNYVEFYVKDNGPGIPEDHHEEIFKLFKKAQSKEDIGGTGAGLTIAKTVIDNHGGKIWVQSQLGYGAAFHFTIPKDLAG